MTELTEDVEKACQLIIGLKSEIIDDLMTIVSYFQEFPPGGSLLRIDPVRATRDDATYECVAENGVGDAVSAEATLTVYEGKCLTILKFCFLVYKQRCLEYFNIYFLCYLAGFSNKPRL